jgi:hypothetical protein
MRPSRPSLLARAAASLALAVAGACAEGASPIPGHHSAFVLSASERQAAEAFEARVKDYRALCRTVSAKVPKLSNRATPEQIDEHQRALGELIKAARAGAKRGDLFTPDVEALVKRSLQAILAGPDAKIIKASIMDENPGVPNLSVNDRYPDAIPLSSMPPQVLESLPKLEEELEYRFIGERLALVDPESHIIIDFTADVLP